MRRRVSAGSRCGGLRQISWPPLTDFRTLIERTFAYWSGGGGRGTVGAAARRTDGRHDRPPARVGAARARRLLVGLGVLGSRRRPPPRSQGGPGAGRKPAPAGAARGLQGGAAARARPRWPDPLGGGLMSRPDR